MIAHRDSIPAKGSLGFGGVVTVLAQPARDIETIRLPHNRLECEVCFCILMLFIPVFVSVLLSFNFDIN